MAKKEWDADELEQMHLKSLLEGRKITREEYDKRRRKLSRKLR